MSTYDQLSKYLGEGRVEQNKNLSPYLTLHIPTTAEFYYTAESKEEIIKAVKTADKLSIPLFILGGGSNLAVVHEKIPGLVVRNMYYEFNIVEDRGDDEDIVVSSGYPVSRFVSETINLGLRGYEYHLGLPGTVGGSIYMNSKWTRPLCYFGDKVMKIELIDRKGKKRFEERDYFKFRYDYSYLQETKEIILDVYFRLEKDFNERLKQHAQKALQYRKQTQPYGVSTAGCFFQNVDGRSAGQMIDRAGLKNTQIGDFVVSDKHANFIINKGKGKPEDLLKLIALVKEKVKKKFGIELKEEVVIV